MTNDINVDMLMNAKQMIGELRSMNAHLHNIQVNTNRMHTKGAAGAKKHASAMAGLALRFVGYQLVLSQVMGAQQKLYQYVTEGITKFREFETRLAEVATIMTDDFEAATSSMKAGIESLALAFGQNTSDLTKGLYDIMSAAFSAKDAMSLLNQATKASIAGISDVRTSVDIFTTVLNTYGMSVYEATKVSDTLFQSVVRGKFQFAELESALGYVVPIAAQAGIAFEDLMAALSTATRHGLHLDMASRGLAMVLQNMINPSEGAAKAAKKYGIEMSGLALRIKGISGVFSEMYDKTKQYGKIVLNELIPNIRSLRVAMVLAGEEGLEGLLDDMDRLSVSAGRTEEALNKIKNTSQFVSNQITQQWEKTQREVGKAWDGIAISAQRGITDIVGNLGNLLPIIGPIFTVLDYENEKQFQKWATKKEKQYLGRRTVSPSDEDYRFEIGRGASYEVAKSGEKATVQMMDYLTLQTEIAEKAKQVSKALRFGDTEKADELNRELMALNTYSAQLGETFNKVFGEPILGGMRELENLRLALDELSFDIERLRTELEKPMEFGWGGFQEKFEAEKGLTDGLKGTLNYNMQVLLSEQELADVRHDISSGIANEAYQYKVLNAEQQNAIKIVREHENAMKKDREETALMNVQMRLLQIQMLELQLVGMIRRRGLSRSEQKRMKALQIEQAKLRLKNMKETKEETAQMHTDYYEKKNILDDYVRDLTENQYQLKYTYDQQVLDLQMTIDYEADILRDRATQWAEKTAEIKALEEQLTADLAAILASDELVSAFDIIGIDITELRDNVLGLIADINTLTQTTWPSGLPEPPEPQGPPTYEEWATTAPPEDVAAIPPFTGDPFEGYTDGVWDPEGRLRDIRGYHRGTEYVHESGLAEIHKGESISAAGKEQQGGITIDTVIIEVKEIAKIDDVEKVAAVLSAAQNSGLLNKSGKTKFRLRTG